MKKVKDHDHSRRRLGPAVVLGPADCDRRSPASILSNLEDCSSTFFLRRTCPLKIFIMPRQMVDMKARESVGGSCCQNAGSSPSSKHSSEEDATGTSSGWTLGVQTACKQLLYELVGRSCVINTRSKESNTASGRKVLHRRVIRVACECLAPRVREELVMMEWKMVLLRQTVCCLVIRSWIICNTGRLKDVVCPDLIYCVGPIVQRNVHFGMWCCP